MPNWCTNNLEVQGSEEEVKRFNDIGMKAIAKEKENEFGEKYGFLRAYFPMPKELEGTTSPKEKPDKKLVEKYGFDNWYDWCVANWGTKWDINIYAKSEPEPVEPVSEMCPCPDWEVGYDFDSAWSPPENWLRKVAKDYPELHFSLHYEEMGMGYYGTITAKGEEFVDDYKDVNHDGYPEKCEVPKCEGGTWRGGDLCNDCQELEWEAKQKGKIVKIPVRKID